MANAHSDLVNTMLLQLSKIPGCRCWKNATGAYQTDDGSWIKYGIEGSADITGIILMGRFGIRLEIECKTGSGKQREAQINYEKMIKSLGGIYIVAREDWKTVIDQLIKIQQNF